MLLVRKYAINYAEIHNVTENKCGGTFFVIIGFSLEDGRSAAHFLKNSKKDDCAFCQ